MARVIEKRTISEVLKIGQLRIPESQRRFEWKGPEAETFIEDLIDEAKTQDPNRNPDGLFLGTIISLVSKGRETGEDIYDIYDGQQRLTTIIVTLLAIRVLAAERGQQNLRSACQNCISYIDEVGEDQGWRFLASPSIKKPLEIAFNSSWDGTKPKSPGTGAHNQDRRFYNFYSQIADRLGKEADKTPDILKSLKKIIDNLQVVFITITEPQEAFDLFERTNARGKPLDVADLLKNQLFKNQKHIDRLSERWAKISQKCGGTAISDGKITQMLRYFYIAYHGHITQKEVYPALLSIIGKGKQSNEALEKIEEFASFYGFMIDQTNGDFSGWASDNGLEALLENEERSFQIEDKIAALKHFKITQTFPLIFAGLLRVKNTEGKHALGNARALANLIDLLEKFHASYSFVCGLPANKVEHLYAEKAEQLSSHKKEINDVRGALATHISKNLKPDFEVFYSNFRDISYNDAGSYNRICYIFDRIYYGNNSVRSDRPSFFRPSNSAGGRRTLQQEHIYPQNPKKGEDYLELLESDESHEIHEMVHNIGNLTILNYENNSGSKKKEGVSNNTPENKFKILEKQRSNNPDYVNRFLDDIAEHHSGRWEIKDIKNRAHRLAKQFFDGYLQIPNS